jgi:ABC-2 type transport system ATP-binding protein
VSSHLLAEIEPICDRVAIVSKGKLIACGTPDEIVEVRSKVAVAYSDCEGNDALRQELDALGAENMDEEMPVRSTEGFEHKALVPVNLLFSFIELLHKRNAQLRTVGSQRESLQDAFMRLIDGGVR